MNPQEIETMRNQNPFKSLNDIVYDILLQEILSFHICPGSRLTESTIAQELAVSRSPVKSALEKLAENNFIEKNKGYHVASFTRKEYDDAMDISYLIEPYAAGQAVSNLTEERLNILYALASEEKSVAKKAKLYGVSHAYYSDIMRLDYAFHSKIIVYSNNLLLQQIYEALKYKLFRYRSYLLYDPPHDFYDIIGNEHMIVCNNLKIGDKIIAEAVMRRHIAISQSKFQRVFKIENLF